MNDKFQQRFRIPSTRLQHWDYRWNAAYFIIICTHNRECFFGEVVDGKMNVSSTGITADILWHETKNHFPTIDLGTFVVMPNHVHGIIIINGNVDNENVCDNINIRPMNTVETRHALSLQPPSNHPDLTIGQQRYQNQGKNSLSSNVGSYKSVVTNHAHRLGFVFQWQSRFYDHIIRDAESFDRITEYICNNPKKWANDKFNEPRR